MNAKTNRSLMIFAALLATILSPVSTAQRKPAKPTTSVYTFDASESQINVNLSQEGLIAKRHPNHTVAAKSFSGRIDLPKDETRLAVTVETQAASLTNVDTTMGDFERKEFHNVLRSTVLEIDKFPSIQFKSVSVTNIQKSGDQRSFTLTGDLTLHGVTRRVVFPVKATITKDHLQATGEAKLKQSDFGMKPFEKGMGLIKIGDEVKVTFTVTAKVQ